MVTGVNLGPQSGLPSPSLHGSLVWPDGKAFLILVGTTTGQTVLRVSEILERAGERKDRTGIAGLILPWVPALLQFRQETGCAL